MLAPYSIPDSGYVTLFPFVDAGNDIAVALHRVGITAANNVPSFGYGIIADGGGCVRLRANHESGARVEALKHAFNRPVTLVKAVSRGRVTLYERMERIELLPPRDVAGVDSIALVAPNGELIEKALNLYESVDFRAVAKQVSGKLRSIDRLVFRKRLEQMLSHLDVDWTKLSRPQVTEIFEGANRFLRGAAVERALPEMTTRVNATLKVVANGVRKQLRETFVPRIGTTFTRDEIVALEKIGTQQGWFIRDSLKNRSDSLTARGRTIVADGLDKGLGRKEIGRLLREKLPALWEGMGKQYANVVAANAVSRARSWAEMVSYQSAGIELLEAQAVLDERTTEVCRFMDGQVIDVSRCMDLASQAANIKNPDDIYTVNPFMRIVNTDEGKRELRTMNGARIAEMIRPGAGRVNDRGEFRAFVSGRQLPDKRIGPPPYHHS